MTRPSNPAKGKSNRLSRQHAADALGAAPIFVLVEPQMGENIGAAARAMLNFGVTALRLVKPRDGWPNEKAGAMAAGASAVIDNVQVYSTLSEALADCHYVMATTARRREMSTPVLDLPEAAAALHGRIRSHNKCAVIFGGERNGLSSEDTSRANAIISVPVNPAFASLNLAQAVCITAYEWSKLAAGDNMLEVEIVRTPAVQAEVDRLIAHFETELNAANYFLPSEKKPLMMRNLRVALTCAGFTKPEIHSLRGAIKALSRKREGK